jgi:hypothetical protein
MQICTYTTAFQLATEIPSNWGSGFVDPTRFERMCGFSMDANSGPRSFVHTLRFPCVGCLNYAVVCTDRKWNDTQDIARSLYSRNMAFLDFEQNIFMIVKYIWLHDKLHGYMKYQLTE